MRSTSIIDYAFFQIFSIQMLNILKLLIVYLINLALSVLTFVTSFIHSILLCKPNLFIKQSLTHFMAISHKILGKFPWIFLCNKIFHIQYFFPISCFLGFLNHIRVYFNIVDYLLVIMNCWRLVWRKSNLSVNHKVIMINTFFHILYRIH